MKNYVDLIYVTLIVIFIVDVSGFTESWKGALRRIIGARELRQLKPFDCSLCMTWWSCIGYSLWQHTFSLETLAVIALLSLLSYPISQLMVFVRESLLTIINQFYNIWHN